MDILSILLYLHHRVEELVSPAMLVPMEGDCLIEQPVADLLRTTPKQQDRQPDQDTNYSQNPDFSEGLYLRIQDMSACENLSVMRPNTDFLLHG